MINVLTTSKVCLVLPACTVQAAKTAYHLLARFPYTSSKNMRTAAGADELPEGRFHSHGVLDPQSQAREYRNAAGGAAATNAGQPWNVVAALATDAGNAVARRMQSLDFRGDEAARERWLPKGPPSIHVIYVHPCADVTTMAS